MSWAMTRAEREAFLADVHVGVLAVAANGQPPLTAPLWYTYEPGGLVSFVTGKNTVKAGLLRAEGQASLCVQSEEPPYRYVTVEGPVVELIEHVDPAERRAIAQRYLGQEVGDEYIAATKAQEVDNLTVRLNPERWRTVDYSKMY